MNKRLVAVSILVASVVFGWLGFFSVLTNARSVKGPLHDVTWTNTSPAINETHLFEGQINKRGQPVGFHSRPEGKDPKNAHLTRITDPPNRAGVYGAEVEIHDTSGLWLKKRSTFFPDAMSREEVIGAVLHAFENRTTGSAQRFSGPSGRGFVIEGYLLPDGRINTAFPVFRKSE